MRLYIAGPMTGKPLNNWPAFEAAEEYLSALGHDVVSPTRIDEDEGYVTVDRLSDGSVWDVSYTDKFDYETVLARDIEWLDTCDGIVLLPGWHHSAGAQREASAAANRSMVFFYGVDAVRPADFMDFDYGAEEITGEHRVVDPHTGGEKGQKLARFDLIPPDALWEVAEHYGRGARKYADRNWERGYAWGLSYGALQRHANAWAAGEDIDEETGGMHMAAVAFHALALLTFSLRDIGTDDRGF